MIHTPGSLAQALTAAVPPLTPDDDEARSWAEQELTNPVYAEAQPTPFDLFARAVADFLGDLLNPQLPAGLESVFAIVAVAVVVVLIIVAFVIWGVPRATPRGTPTSAVAISGLPYRYYHLFRQHDQTSADGHASHLPSM